MAQQSEQRLDEFLEFLRENWEKNREKARLTNPRMYRQYLYDETEVEAEGLPVTIATKVIKAIGGIGLGALLAGRSKKRAAFLLALGMAGVALRDRVLYGQGVETPAPVPLDLDPETLDAIRSRIKHHLGQD